VCIGRADNILDLLEMELRLLSNPNEIRLLVRRCHLPFAICVDDITLVALLGELEPEMIIFAS
jgi:hypothetical protein